MDLLGTSSGASAFSMLIATGTFGSFAWAVKHHFAASRTVPLSMSALSIGSMGAFVAFLYLIGFGEHRDATSGVGDLLVLAAAWLFWTTIRQTRRKPPPLAYTGGQPSILHQGGPYRYVRHPFYVCYIVFWFGTALIAGGFQWLMALALATCYLAVALAEERQLERSPAGSQYLGYKRQVGMLIPRIGRLGGSLERSGRR